MNSISDNIYIVFEYGANAFANWLHIRTLEKNKKATWLMDRLCSKSKSSSLAYKKELHHNYHFTPDVQPVLQNSFSLLDESGKAFAVHPVDHKLYRRRTDGAWVTQSFTMPRGMTDKKIPASYAQRTQSDNSAILNTSLNYQPIVDEKRHCTELVFDERNRIHHVSLWKNHPDLDVCELFLRNDDVERAQKYRNPKNTRGMFPADNLTDNELAALRPQLDQRQFFTQEGLTKTLNVQIVHPLVLTDQQLTHVTPDVTLGTNPFAEKLKLGA